MLVSSEGVPAVRLHTQGPDFYEKTFFLKRGDLNQKQGEAPPGFLQMCSRRATEKRWQASPPAGARTSMRADGAGAAGSPTWTPARGICWRA